MEVKKDCRRREFKTAFVAMHTITAKSRAAAARASGSLGGNIPNANRQTLRE